MRAGKDERKEKKRRKFLFSRNANEKI